MNFGSVLRAAHCYDADMVILDAPRFLNEASNVTRAERHIPMLVGSIEDCRPYNCEMVVVELVDGATPLPQFKHPERAMYVFGPEDGSVPTRIVKKAQHVVFVPTSYCMNLAATANVVLYDRKAKQLERLTKPNSPNQERQRHSGISDISAGWLSPNDELCRYETEQNVHRMASQVRQTITSVIDGAPADNCAKTYLLPKEK